jgi:hypothetical protein
LPTLRSPSLLPPVCLHSYRTGAATHNASMRHPPWAATCHRKRHWHKSYAIPMLTRTHAIASKPRIGSHVEVVPSCSFLTLASLPPLAHWLPVAIEQYYNFYYHYYREYFFASESRSIIIVMKQA